MKRRLLLFFILFSSLVTAQNNIYRSGGITQTVGAPTFTPGASGNIVAIDTVTGEWYVNPNRLSGSSWISAGYRLTNISGSVPPAYTPTAHQSHFVVNGANQLYYWDGSSWQSVGGGGGSTDALRLKFIVVNKSGGTLNKGEVVYVSGAQGNRVAVKKALASADSLSANTLGVMDETVADNGEGYCVAEGLVSGINTSAFTEGAALYLSPTTAGGITQTKTTAPDHLVLIGYCVKSNAGSGEISVHIQNGYELGELHDVYAPAPTNGQVLTYNNTNSRWEAATVADQSATNELQTIDTFSLSGQTLSVSLLNDGAPASSVTLPIVDVVAGTNVTVTKSNGVATVSATGGGGGGGISDLNGLTASTQTFATGTTGTDFNIASATSTHTFNLPTASATNRGALSSADWSAFNSKIDGTGAANKVAFFTGTGTLSNNTNFHWDNTNGRLGINQSTPLYRLHVGSSTNSAAGTPIAFFALDQNDNTSLQVSNATNGSASLAGFYAFGASGQTGYMLLPSSAFSDATIRSTLLFEVNSSVSNGMFFNVRSSGSIVFATSTNRTPRMRVFNNGNVIIKNSSHTDTGYRLQIDGNSATHSLQVIAPNSNSGTNALIIQNTTPLDLYKIEANGKISYLATNTAAGTTGAQTIDRPSGTVNFGIGASSLVVTNSLCTTSSIVFATVRTNDATAQIKNVVPAAGSFTINLSAAATAETSVGFFIIN